MLRQQDSIRHSNIAQTYNNNFHELNLGLQRIH
jgi:hypothetical protein